MLVGVAPLPYSFPPSRTLAFYFINRPPWANILVPSVFIVIMLSIYVLTIYGNSYSVLAKREENHTVRAHCTRKLDHPRPLVMFFVSAKRPSYTYIVCTMYFNDKKVAYKEYMI